MDSNKYRGRMRRLLDTISRYFDLDALDYDYRYRKNYILRRMKREFRGIIISFPFERALDLGCGTGEDIVFFAKKFPDRFFYGVDASRMMVKIAERKIEKFGLKNASVIHGYIEEIDDIFEGEKFDLIYSFFGALNSVLDLKAVAERLRKKINDRGLLVVSVVNKMYMMDFLVNMFLLRPKKAFERALGKWRGYSPHKKIPSRVISPKLMILSFGKYFHMVFRRGFSILYPPWYYSNIYLKLTRPFSKIDNFLWKADEYLSKTPLWQLGEYALYAFKPR